MKNQELHKKIEILNDLAPDLVGEEDNLQIIKNFTDKAVEIFEADFGFAWGTLVGNGSHQLLYKTKNAPSGPTIPRRKKDKVINPLFNSHIKKGNYEPGAVKNLKSYLIIPIKYGDHIYGHIVMCYKNQRDYSREELALATTMGNTAAQSITINWLVENEQKMLSLAQKQKETEVLLSQEKLKTEFVANATHELRTPLAIMKGNVDLALLSKDNVEVMKNSLKEINLEINILTDILKDLALLTSSSENVENILRSSPIIIRVLLAKIVTRLNPLANEKKIKIKVSGDMKFALSTLGDENYLEKLFLNLIKNAIAYGKNAGKIDIKISKEKSMLKVQIIDNGIGISKDDLPKIFERFYRADKSHSAHGIHSGLGLPIARWIAEIHQGSINVTSVEKKGSTFTVLLPLFK